MLDLIHDHFFWPHMAVQVKEHIEQCCLCLTFKAKQPRAPLENIIATHPLEVVHFDYVCLEPGNGREENILVVTDHFTQFAQAYVIQSQIALMTAKALWDNFIIHYGLPKEILFKQGRNFKSELIADLCKLMGTWKLGTSPYHPQTNGQWERFNSALIGMLGTLSPEWKSDWKSSIGALVHTYKCTRNSAMGFSPYFLMYGRQPHLPIDVTLGLALTSVPAPTSTKYVQKLREYVRWAHRKAEQFQQKEVQCHKQNYDRCSRAVDLREEDKVLVHATAFRGRHKIQNWWENREYVVEWWPYPNLPVYVVTLGMGKGAARPYIGTTCYRISNNLEWAQEKRFLTSLLWCHLQIVGYQPMDWLRVDWKANQTCSQNSLTQST